MCTRKRRLPPKPKPSLALVSHRPAIVAWSLTLGTHPLKRSLNPAGIRPPFGRYSPGVAIPSESELVFCSGQLGLKAGDLLPPTVGGQAEVCFQNIAAILAEAGMTLADVVRINAYVTKREHMKEYMEVRDRYVADPLPASTLMIVSGFTRPEFLVEIEVVAAKG